MDASKPDNFSLDTVGHKKIDLDDFKALYYMLNAKPDTDIKLFPEPKRVSPHDLFELNNKVMEKLKNHDMITNLTKVTLDLSGNRIQEYESWAEFERAKWDIASHTESISISWEMNFILPNKKLPQPHTMKLKIGSPLNPTEMFHLVLSQDVHEIKSNMSNFVCKIDYINAVLCNELFLLVAEWHKALPSLQPEGRVEKIVKNHPKRIRESVKLLILSSGLLVLIAINHLILKLHAFDINSGTFLERGYQWLIASAFAVYLVFIVGKIFGDWIYNNIDRIKDVPMFDLTKGDKNRSEEINQKNNKLMKEISLKLAVSALIFLIGLFFNQILSPLFSLLWPN